MITRKSGETHKQYCQRLETALENSYNNNRSLRIQFNTMNDEVKTYNPRTGMTYKSEAEVMFSVLVLAEQQLRLNNPEMVKMLLQEGIQRIGFTIVDIYDNSLANNLGKYNG